MADEEDRTLAYSLTITWDKAEITDLGVERLALGHMAVMADTVRKLAEYPETDIRWWTGTVRTFDDLVTYRWAMLED